MLEESRMDKKSLSRSTQPQSRASAIDCKKSTESTHKPWPRNNKKREGPGSAPKNEPYRKNVPPQRGRGQVDRRPRSRGGPSNFTVGGAQNTGIEDDDEPEIGSVFVPGSKKQNLNHLLNFMLPTRGSQQRGLDRRGPLLRRQAPPRALHRLDHDLYLRANCQFVVKDNGDYKANLLDPDVPVKWEQVEEIVVRSTGRSECPICLGTPVAGRVGHCGHVYCWACVLHYAATHDKQPPPCPVCTTPLQVKDMKPTLIVQWESPGEQVTMRLVRRLRGSTTVEIAPPRGQLMENKAEGILTLESVNHAPYSKFFAASKQQVHDILKRERKEIQDQIMAEIDTSEIVYLEQALEMLKLKEEKVNTHFEQPKVIQTEKVDDMVPITYEKQSVNENKIDWFDFTGDDTGPTNTIQEQVEDLAIGFANSELNPEAPNFVVDDINENQPEEFLIQNAFVESEINEQIEDDSKVTDIDKQNQAKYFYFYQADDGQQVFLHNLNVRILNASWGPLAAAPRILSGRVLHRETHSLSEQARKHMPFTAHLPLYCSFDIVELDLQPPFVTTEALCRFGEEIQRRVKTRERCEREEKKRERAYRRAMEGPPKPDFSSALVFPSALPAQPHASELPPMLIEESSPSTSVSSSSGLSFAKMASSSGTWRVRKPVPPPPPPPDEDEASAPHLLNLNDVLEAASRFPKVPSGGKKNKKSKHKVLFATGMQRAA